MTPMENTIITFSVTHSFHNGHEPAAKEVLQLWTPPTAGLIQDLLGFREITHVCTGFQLKLNLKWRDYQLRLHICWSVNCGFDFVFINKS